MTAEYPAVPATQEELIAQITSLVKAVADPDVKLGVESDGYGKCVEAMWPYEPGPAEQVAGWLREEQSS